MQSLKTGGAKRFRARRLAWLGRRPDTASKVIDLLYDVITSDGVIRRGDDVIPFSPEKLESFRNWLVANDKSERTINERLRYLKRLVASLGWFPTIDDVFAFLSRQSAGAREHYLKALRLWLQYIGREDLLNRFKGGWVIRESDHEAAITLNEALAAIKIAAINSRRYALYLATLLVTGLRPHEVRALRWDNEVIPQVIKLEKKSRYKRAYYAFLTPKLYTLLLQDSRDSRVVKWRRETEYRTLKLIKEEIPAFRPYELRALNTALLLKAGIPEPIIKFIHGWAPRSTMRRYYIDKQLSTKEMLKDILKKHNKALEEIDSLLERILSPTSLPTAPSSTDL